MCISAENIYARFIYISDFLVNWSIVIWLIRNYEILPINVGQESISKSLDFFNEININNLNVYFDPSSKLPKTFLLRGLPTSVFINKDGKEFARIVGAVDFQDSELIEWLKKFE